ncbi:hypothetical protein KFK09_017900 [Dendrobium nobile]|uniref:Uncharacterized protein n=1 Tax=Dendrobium nobile TaxID=94219 RepID=A0A8T3AVE1_DENNO|nr:hypothetical protein KFK09_017900 [Dendrobium nobile]
MPMVTVDAGFELNPAKRQKNAKLNITVSARLHGVFDIFVLNPGYGKSDRSADLWDKAEEARERVKDHYLLSDRAPVFASDPTSIKIS